MSLVHLFEKKKSKVAIELLEKAENITWLGVLFRIVMILCGVTKCYLLFKYIFFNSVKCNNAILLWRRFKDTINNIWNNFLQKKT